MVQTQICNGGVKTLFISTVQETRICTICNQTKHVYAFGSGKRSRGGRRNQCKSCLNAQHHTRVDSAQNYAYIKQYRARHPMKRRGYNLKRDYGITLEQYNTMLAAQNGACKICENTSPGTRSQSVNFSVDHCHKTKRIRGLLCTSCNRGIGHFKDDPALMRRAADYLSSAKAGGES